MNAAPYKLLAVSPADRKQSYGGMWLAITIAVLLHVFLLYLPVIQHQALPPLTTRSVEIQVTRFTPEPTVENPPEPPTETIPTPAKTPPPLAETPAPQTMQPQDAPLPEPRQTTPPVASTSAMQPEKQTAGLSTGPSERQALTSRILSRQYLSEESAADKVFGPAIQINSQPANKAFHFPDRDNMITMLDRPVNDLPFAYTPGLVEFSYDPGVKGDMQRFFDKITPEFSWRTKYRTKVKCKWVLVIVACGWGRSDD